MAEGSRSGGGGGGIDRKNDERMEFTTSKEVTVHPTFESMSLKGEALTTFVESREYGGPIRTYSVLS